MADLLDIAPATSSEAVWIDGQRYTVRGLSFNDAALIISRFPNVGDLFRGGVNPSVVPQLIEQLGRVVGPVIAAGCGHSGDERYEMVAGSMVMDHQLIFLEPIWRLTCPNGIRSFMERLTRVMGTGEGARKPLKIRSKKSASPSPHSSDRGSHPTMQ